MRTRSRNSLYSHFSYSWRSCPQLFQRREEKGGDEKIERKRVDVRVREKKGANRQGRK